MMEDSAVYIILAIVGILCFYITVQSFFSDNN